MGNIVLDMTISKIDKEIDDYVRKGVNKAMGYDTNHLTEQEIIRLNSKNGLLLFCLFPSYGAEIYCVCEKNDFQQITNLSKPQIAPQAQFA